MLLPRRLHEYDLLPLYLPLLPNRGSPNQADKAVVTATIMGEVEGRSAWPNARLAMEPPTALGDTDTDTLNLLLLLSERACRTAAAVAIVWKGWGWGDRSAWGVAITKSIFSSSSRCGKR